MMEIAQRSQTSFSGARAGRTLTDIICDLLAGHDETKGVAFAIAAPKNSCDFLKTSTVDCKEDHPQYSILMLWLISISLDSYHCHILLV